ncbi:flagellar hook-basal body complex protein FliE [Rhodobacteraceae bacterium B1Z28]|uniref:Flagellar hook-basal body complex protein FliE n=1 Tax=Ruegeria haliotis TaxID=2747601 RepID=A0ABX2PRR3_9RHOB|nr:flagellar hook-basal body complex protein FliE [Ruegeria haliotis]NVO56815.1 flagellar hook-basal body complex protein FliE [Ruegeria haliotis]
MDIRSLSAAQSYAFARPATQPEPDHNGMAQGMRLTFQDFATTLKHSEHMAEASMVGQADPHALVQALAQTELAVETAVIVRNKVVEAYQEILRMPV